MTDRLQIMPTRSAMLPQSATLLQRKCACGTHTPAGASCPTCSEKASLLQRQPAGTKLPPPVLEPEFPLEPLVQDNTPKSNEEEYAEAGGKVVEAILETGPGKAATDWLTGKLFGSVPATAATLTGIGGGIAGLALTGKELPFQMPFVPLPPRFVGVEGLSVKFIFNGPVNNPTEGVLVFRYELPSGKKPRRTEPEKGDFVPGPRGFAANDQALSDAAISYAVAQESARFAKIRENEAAAEPAAPSGLTFPRPSLLSGGLAPGLTFDPINSLLLGEELKLELPPFILPKFDSPTLQKKLAIGASDDPLEAEADKVADHVLSRPANGGNVAPLIQRFTAPMSSEVGTVPESVQHTLASAGTPLDSGVRQDMETRFGHDFTGVRVHNDAAASQSARDVDAHAYTVGHNIVFGAGQFAPGSSAGRRLLAHELTHVVQQGGEASPNLFRKVEMRDVGKGEQSGFARLDELVTRLNAISSGLDFAMNGKELTYTARDGGTANNFDTQMMGFIDQDPVIPLRLTNRHGLLGSRATGFNDNVDGDSFTTGYVDIDDLLAGSDLGMASLLLHFLRERSETKNYAKRIGTNFTQAEFDKAHAKGIDAEVALLRDFFSDPSIRLTADSPSDRVRREYTNSRRDFIRRVIKKGRGKETGIEASSIEVTTRDGKKHTPEEYREILKAAKP